MADDTADLTRADHLAMATAHHEAAGEHLAAASDHLKALHDADAASESPTEDVAEGTGQERAERGRVRVLAHPGFPPGSTNARTAAVMRPR
jgi:hypothetical protein